ncbi:hypothetical protein [Algoriphagus sp. A40]|uniref:hypothetical protein n=1 Tax=Algoriphagus sp. A40 TaxID=1945863 RepID=UPI000985A481|nr:hypothetical protein [Algoriphagus sp. A40]OOG73143.1 hypothetical protein B0E43_14650 [Algoriphagus sp. A40]
MRPILRYLVFLGLVLQFSCGKSPEKQARELLEKSIAAHGDEEGWDEISSLKFRKVTKLLNEDGSVESELDQWHEFRFKPYFEGKITWTKDSISHVATWDGTQMHYFMGENEVQNAGFLASKKKDFDAAFYAVAQPWKLLDEEAKLIYEGQKTLENGKLVEVIRVDYGPDSDIWWYYFDPETAEMVANEIQLKDHRSLVYNLGFEEVEGFRLHGKRESWRVNEKGEKLFLRAEYVYLEYEIEFEK